MYHYELLEQVSPTFPLYSVSSTVGERGCLIHSFLTGLFSSDTALEAGWTSTNLLMVTQFDIPTA
jgi:hypothetical protein